MGFTIERKKISRQKNIPDSFVLVAEKDKDWLWINWDKPVEFWNKNSFYISKYLADNDVRVED